MTLHFLDAVFWRAEGRRRPAHFHAVAFEHLFAERFAVSAAMSVGDQPGTRVVGELENRRKNIFF
jgi:hypothetical protein